MKLLRTLALLLTACALLLTACHEEDTAPQPRQLPVNYANLAGTWQLESFGGNAPAPGTWVYLVLERRDHTFLLHDNLSSMYGQRHTGTYTLTEDEDTEQTLLSGTYDNGLGEWNHEYIVLSLTEDRLTLQTTDAPRETTVYARIPALPEEVNIY